MEKHECVLCGERQDKVYLRFMFQSKTTGRHEMVLDGDEDQFMSLPTFWRFLKKMPICYECAEATGIGC